MDHAIASAPVSLPESGWELRVGRAIGDRPALEVHTGDGLIDVAVPGAFQLALVRGAVRGHGWSVIWGRLPPDGSVSVEFRRRLFGAGRAGRAAAVVPVADAFWVAEVAGAFRTVVVTVAGEAHSWRTRRFRSGRSFRG